MIYTTKIIEFNNIKTNAYTIDENGNIFSKITNKYLKTRLDKDGYVHAAFMNNDGSRCDVRLATLMLNTFNGAPPADMKDPTANHKDFNRLNNNINNLEWMERKENSSIKKQLPKGELNGRTKLTNNEVKKIWKYLQNNKFTVEELAKKYNVTTGIIKDIKNRVHWTFLTDTL